MSTHFDPHPETEFTPDPDQFNDQLTITAQVSFHGRPFRRRIPFTNPHLLHTRRTGFIQGFDSTSGRHIYMPQSTSPIPTTDLPQLSYQDHIPDPDSPHTRGPTLKTIQKRRLSTPYYDTDNLIVARDGDTHHPLYTTGQKTTPLAHTKLR